MFINLIDHLSYFCMIQGGTEAAENMKRDLGETYKILGYWSPVCPLNDITAAKMISQRTSRVY